MVINGRSFTTGLLVGLGIGFLAGVLLMTIMWGTY